LELTNNLTVVFVQIADAVPLWLGRSLALIWLS
jgi:hypothetical protein